MKVITVFIVGAVLLGFTTLSFGLSRLELDAFAVPVALAIAVIKTSAIGWHYMHLKEQPAGSRLTLLAAVSLALVLIVLVVLESADRAPLATVPGPFLPR
jgi:caa(3)-type oxidase subunit IV